MLELITFNGNDKWYESHASDYKWNLYIVYEHPTKMNQLTSRNLSGFHFIYSLKNDCTFKFQPNLLKLPVPEFYSLVKMKSLKC